MDKTFEGLTKSNYGTLFAIQLVVAFALFVLDVVAGPGIADGIGNSIVVVLCLWNPKRSYALWWAAFASFLVILGGIVSAKGGVGHAAWINRTLALCTIWVVWFLTRSRAGAIEALKAQEVEARQANEAKSTFLANMSHELRTPLNAIIGFSEVMKTEVFGPLGDSHYRDYVRHIFDSGGHLLGLINDVLDMSKLEAGQLQLHEENVELGTAVRASMHFVEPQAHKAKVRLLASIDPRFSYVRVDDRRFRQILINLLSNAVKFTPEGGEVRISSFPKDGGLAISIRDTGIGIANEKIPKALECFGQIDSSLNRKYDGTGLGLPLANHLIGLHGGILSLDSKIGVGTTVTILLPPERIVSVELSSHGQLAIAI